MEGFKQGDAGHRVPLDKVLGTVSPAIRGMLNAAPTRRCWEYRLGGAMRNTCACLRSNCVPGYRKGLSFPQVSIITRHFPLAFAEATIGRLEKDSWTLGAGGSGRSG